MLCDNNEAFPSLLLRSRDVFIQRTKSYFCMKECIFGDSLEKQANCGRAFISGMRGAKKNGRIENGDVAGFTSMPDQIRQVSVKIDNAALFCFFSFESVSFLRKRDDSISKFAFCFGTKETLIIYLVGRILTWKQTKIRRRFSPSPRHSISFRLLTHKTNEQRPCPRSRGFYYADANVQFSSFRSRTKQNASFSCFWRKQGTTNYI